MLALAAIAVLCLSQAPSEDECLRGRCRELRSTGRSSRSARAVFEFAPSSGAGMGAACTCLSVTGSQGEALTFTRASSGTCLKSGTTSSIANGDLVTCSTDQPRVMPGGDGSGPLGLLVEGARTNSLLRSEAFDNAAWTAVNVISAAPTVTANQAVAPDGTMTADRLQVPVTGASSASYIYQAECPVGTDSGSVFLKGVSGSGSVYLAVGNSFTNRELCSFNSSTWTRCVKENLTFGSKQALAIGSSPLEGSNQLGAIDVYVWGAQCEVGPHATSYIATAGSAATRAEELALFARPSGMSNTEGCMGATVISPVSPAARAVLPIACRTHFSGSLGWVGATTLRLDDGTNLANATTVSPTNRVARAAGGWKTGVGLRVAEGAASGTGASYDDTMCADGPSIGSYDLSGDYRVDGVVKQVVVDSLQTGCSP